MSGKQNDLCQDALAVEINTVTSGSTLGATSDLSNLPGNTEADKVCFDEDYDPYMAFGVWYTITAPSCGKVEINYGAAEVNMCEGMGSASYDAALSIYSGSCGDLTCVAGGDDIGCTFASGTRFSFNAQSGNTYYILVHGYDDATGNFDLQFSASSEFGQCGGKTLDKTKKCGYQNDAQSHTLIFNFV